MLQNASYEMERVINMMNKSQSDNLKSIIARLDPTLFQYVQTHPTMNVNFADYAEDHLLTYRKELREPFLSCAELAYRMRLVSREIHIEASSGHANIIANHNIQHENKIYSERSD